MSQYNIVPANLNPMQEEAIRLAQAGFLVLPTVLGGAKHPNFKWKSFKHGVRPCLLDLANWFRDEHAGMCVVGGQPSGNLEVLDFDDHSGRGNNFREWAYQVPEAIKRQLVYYSTPSNGWRVCYRCPSIIPGPKERLAMADKTTCIIECLALQIILVPGGHPNAHRLGKPYVYEFGHLASVQTITPEERATILTAARSLNQWTAPPGQQKERQPRAAVPDYVRPALGESRPTWHATDDFNVRGSWPDIMEPHDWVCMGQAGEVSYWCRPGKDSGISATINWDGTDRLYVFSDNAGLEPNKHYTKWAALTFLEFDADFSKSAKELTRRGYGRANQEPSPEMKALYNL